VPGAAAGVTRPILQTGSYGENIGQVVLDYDPTSGETSTVLNQNVPRTEVEDAELVATYPRVAAVQTITDAALAAAAVIGNEPIGSLEADITRASIDGVTPVEEDRAAPSALGTLVANSLRDSLADQTLGGAEIGVVNPGGMRADLSTSPDSVISYAEANAVLPFVNNLWTTTLTGAQFKTALEQQWQRDDEGEVPSRPYLQLGLSDNVNYTFDAARAEGDRITGIWVDDIAIDPVAEYRIGSFNFLLTGGDNFRVFADGTDTRDSGLVDRDAWIDYIGANSPLAPSFAARQASVTGLPTAAVAPGDTVTFTVGQLNLTSTGAPLNTELTIDWAGSASSFPAAAVDTTGAATVAVTVPADAPTSSELTLTATESGTIVRVPLAVTAAVPTPTPTVPAPTPTPTDPAPTDTPTEPAPTETPAAPEPTAPAVAPTPAPLSALTDALRGLVGTDKRSYAPGAPITVTVTTERAGDFVSVWARSTPVNLDGWLRVSADGAVTTTVPSDLAPGTHRIIVQDTTGVVIGWTEITVVGATTATGLAATGIDATPWLAGGVLALLLGAALMRHRRVSMES